MPAYAHRLYNINGFYCNAPDVVCVAQIWPSAVVTHALIQQATKCTAILK